MVIYWLATSVNYTIVKDDFQAPIVQGVLIHFKISLMYQKGQGLNFKWAEFLEQSITLAFIREV